MASSYFPTSRSSSSTWTPMENKRFETALALYDKETPERWHNIARYVGTKSEEEVKMQYVKLVRDVYAIDSGHTPLPKCWD